MDSKNYTKVLIDGKIYTLAGSEDETYMQRVAGYINEMILTMRKQDGFTRQTPEYQTAMIELNMADDYFKARTRIDELEHVRRDLEKEIYSIKHELVSTQMKLEEANKRSSKGKRPEEAS